MKKIIIERLRLLPLILSYFVLFTAQNLFAQNLDLETASQGLPSVANYLNKESFIEVKAKRLASAQVLWVNMELLHEMGIQVPAEGLNAELEKKILNSFAYIVPRDTDSPSEFLSVEKTFYADRYGGTGTGYAQGSGRAAGAGLFQIKGIGRTDLAGPVNEGFFDKKLNLWNPIHFMFYVWSKFVLDNHTHGGSTLRESMAEAVWGEILNKELPYGANRVVAIIGTDQAIGISKLPRALIVRQNSIRPAHYIQNDNNPELSDEKARVRMLIEPFLKLPVVAKESRNTGMQLRKVIEAIAERISRKMGTEYAIGLFHGSSSPSNIEVTGRALDHGPMTALDNFTKAINIDDFPNGDIRVALYDFVYQVIDDFRKTVDVQYREFIPKKPEIKQLMVEAYENQIQIEILWRLGLPAELAKEMIKYKAVRDFSDLLLRVGQEGNDEIKVTQRRVPLRTGTYDFNLVLQVLSDDLLSTAERRELLSEQISDAELVLELLRARSLFIKRLEIKSVELNIKIENLEQYMKLASQQRNQTRKELMRGGLMYLRQYMHMFIWTLTRMAPSISSYVSAMTSKYTQSFEVFSDFDLVLEERKDYKTGSALRRVYDAKSGTTKVEIVGDLINNQIYFFGNKISINPARSNELVVTDAKGNVIQVMLVTRKQNRFSIQLADSDSSLLKYTKIKQIFGLIDTAIPSNIKLRCEQVHLKVI